MDMRYVHPYLEHFTEYLDRDLEAASIPLVDAYIAGNGKRKRAGHCRVSTLQTFFCSAAIYAASITLPDAISHFLQHNSAHHPPHICTVQHTLRPIVRYMAHGLHVYYPPLNPPVVANSGTSPATLTRLNLLVVLFSLSPIEIARYPSTH